MRVVGRNRGIPELRRDTVLRSDHPVCIQRAAITRVRPAFTPGWGAEFEITVLLPDYVSDAFLHRLVSDAGRFVGLGDFRPTYGRYQLVHWDVIQD